MKIDISILYLNFTGYRHIKNLLKVLRAPATKPIAASGSRTLTTPKAEARVLIGKSRIEKVQ